MNIFTRTQGHELTEELAAHVDRHVRFALARFAKRVRRVHVQISDVNGPRGGVDMECKIRVELSSRGFLVVKEADACEFAAVADATSRIGHAVSRHMDRFKDARRGKLRRAQRLVDELAV